MSESWFDNGAEKRTGTEARSNDAQAKVEQLVNLRRERDSLRG